MMFFVFRQTLVVIMPFYNGQPDETMSGKTTIIIFCNITDPGF